jgi:gluconolactonase
MSRTSLLFVVLLTGFAALPAAAQEQKIPGKTVADRAIIGTVERLDPRFDLLVPKDARLEKIADGFIWTCGDGPTC